MIYTAVLFLEDLAHRCNTSGVSWWFPRWRVRQPAHVTEQPVLAVAGDLPLTVQRGAGWVVRTPAGDFQLRVKPDTAVTQGSHILALSDVVPGDTVTVYGYTLAQATVLVRKIEVHRTANGKPPLFPGDPAIAGIVTDAEIDTTLPVAHLDDTAAVAAMMKAQAMAIEEVFAMSARNG